MILFISPKETYFTKRFLLEAAVLGLPARHMDMAEASLGGSAVAVAAYRALYLRFCYPYIRQACELAQRFVREGKPVVDASLAEGDVGKGKLDSYGRLAAAGLPVPLTRSFLDGLPDTYPCVAKWNYGFGGRQVFLLRNAPALEKARQTFPPSELLLQEYVKADYEYKVVTVGYRSLPVVLRVGFTPKSWRPDFRRAEVLALGQGCPEAERAAAMAEQAARSLRRELSKVDILEKNGSLYVLEANRWPGLRSFERLTGMNAVKEFAMYIAKKIQDGKTGGKIVSGFFGPKI